MKYVLGIDQSTQGTKAVLVDSNGVITARCDKPHRQIIDDKGYVSHDAEEIFQNVLSLVPQVTEKAKINKNDIVAVGITNQRETTVLFDENAALAHAVVWQCSRGQKYCDSHSQYSEIIKQKTGLKLSPYFPAAKAEWLLNNIKPTGTFMIGTIDAWLVYRLTGNFKTDYSNAARTQLFNIHTHMWDKELCSIFNIPLFALPEVMDSDSDFGSTDFNGYLEKRIPVTAIMADSNAALFAHGCLDEGMAKATYGTGTSVMMNTGSKLVSSNHGLATSIAWKINNKLQYVLEGNINYSAAVISWLKNDLGLISSPDEAEKLALKANPNDTTVLVPAFSGLSAPYYKSDAQAVITGMTRLTGKAEIAAAALNSIAFQVDDVVMAMKKDSGINLEEIKADGGAVKNRYLMQTQSDLSDTKIAASNNEECSVIGVSMLAAKKMSFEFNASNYARYEPKIEETARSAKKHLWQKAIKITLEN